MHPQAAKWNQRYQCAEIPASEMACEVLQGNAALLPERGRALDLACGLGANALFMAERGLQVEAWDISGVAIEKLQTRASQRKLAITAVVRDVEAAFPATAEFDVICVSRFLFRPLLPMLVSALRPNGLLFYQTFNREKLQGGGPDNPAYLLAPNELLRHFSALRLRFYQEYGQTGDSTQGNRGETLYVGQRTG